MRSLVDTCTLSELRQPNGNPSVKSAVADFADANLYLSVVTVGEIVKGVALLAPGKKKKALGSWLVSLEAQFADRTLGVDVETARIWGELTARCQKKGIIVPTADGLLAATALRHGLHVMTRNTQHFEATGALIFDPWQDM